MANYTLQTPSTYPVNPSIIETLEEYMKIADNNALINEFAELYTPNGTIIVGSKKAVGRDAIAAIRKKAVTETPILKRQHRAGKIFQFGEDSNEVMLYGSTDYWLKNGKELSIDWASRGIFVEFEGRMRMEFYQTYTDWFDFIEKEASK